MLCLKPPNPTFWCGFFKIALHEQSPIFKAHFFKQNYINLLIFRANFLETYSLGEFLKIHLIGHFFTKSPSMIEACLFLRNRPPPHPNLRTVSQFRWGVGGVPVHRWIPLNIYLPIYLVIFVKEKSVILQSWLKKSVPTLGKFMVDNN